uniref:glutathione S-transferase-like isoform X5 n=1 Tax=Arvicanthis niloticus TaxID=61156 RepID=UPI001486D497|nr:glutathione S-transferase-like isoform X5 [Arvicanthis niloticus]
MPMTLGYWDIRGLGQAIRLLLEYTDSSYEEKRYTMGDAPDYDRSQWLSEKFKLGLDFPNEKRKPEYLEGLHDKMKLYSEFLGKQPWFAGDKITYVDFLVYDVLDKHRLFEPTCLDAFPNLKNFMAQFEALKKISAYMKSSRFLSGPMYLKTAWWGNK